MIVNSTKYLEFKYAKSPSNNDWYYVNRTNDSTLHDSAVCITTIVNLDGKYNYLLLKTKRPPLYAENKAQYCIESPAGLIGDINKSECLIDCIKKELLEEAGLYSDKIFIELKNSSTSSGLSSETLTYATVIVDDYKIAKEPVSDGGVIVDRFFVECDKIAEFIANLDHKTHSIASATICGIFFAQKRI